MQKLKKKPRHDGRGLLYGRQLTLPFNHDHH